MYIYLPLKSIGFFGTKLFKFQEEICFQLKKNMGLFITEPLYTDYGAKTLLIWNVQIKWTPIRQMFLLAGCVEKSGKWVKAELTSSYRQNM